MANIKISQLQECNNISNAYLLVTERYTEKGVDDYKYRSMKMTYENLSADVCRKVSSEITTIVDPGNITQKIEKNSKDIADLNGIVSKHHNEFLSNVIIKDKTGSNMCHVSAILSDYSYANNGTIYSLISNVSAVNNSLIETLSSSVSADPSNINTLSSNLNELSNNIIGLDAGSLLLIKNGIILLSDLLANAFEDISSVEEYITIGAKELTDLTSLSSRIDYLISEKTKLMQKLILLTSNSTYTTIESGLNIYNVNLANSFKNNTVVSIRSISCDNSNVIILGHYLCNEKLNVSLSSNNTLNNVKIYLSAYILSTYGE